MKKRNRLWNLLFFVFICCGIPVEGLAFSCSNTGGDVIVNVDPAVFRNNPVTFSTKAGQAWQSATISTTPASALAESGFRCVLNYSYGDRVGITAINNIHSAIGSTDYTQNLRIATSDVPSSPVGGSYAFSAVTTSGNACLFCGGAGGWYQANTPVITVSLTRTANWVAKPINNGDTLLKLTVRRTDYSQAIGTITFKMAGTVAYPTCTITNPGNRTVTLPPVPKSDLQSTGTGRYNAVKGEFSFNMNCAEGTKVKVKFEGDKLTGEDYALINKAPGGLNTAVGIQIVERSSNTAMKIDEAEMVFNPAATGGNTLNFDAYYFKSSSGTIDGGPIKANATYTFTYE